jgi:hypothetical protein
MKVNKASWHYRYLSWAIGPEPEIIYDDYPPKRIISTDEYLALLLFEIICAPFWCFLKSWCAIEDWHEEWRERHTIVVEGGNYRKE